MASCCWRDLGQARGKFKRPEGSGQAQACCSLLLWRPGSTALDPGTMPKKKRKARRSKEDEEPDDPQDEEVAAVAAEDEEAPAEAEQQ